MENIQLLALRASSFVFQPSSSPVAAKYNLLSTCNIVLSSNDSGNHDAGLAESVSSRAARLSTITNNLTVCVAPEPLIIESIDIAFPPAPFTKRIALTP